MAAQNLDKRELALRATLELIAEQGFHATPMSQIAERAGIGVGTIYRYFPSKEDLINALYLETKQQISSFILSGFVDSADVLDGLVHILGRTIVYATEHRLETQFIEQYEHSPLIRAATKHAGAAIVQPLVQLLERGIAERVLKPLPLPLLGALLSGPTIAIAKIYADGELAMSSVSLQDAVRAILDSIRR